jgi:Tfp pilus assembly protein PilF
MLKHRHLIWIPIFAVISLMLTGCGTKTISRAPEVSYGNPEYKHMKDLPRFRYNPDADQPEKIAAKEMPLTADEYVALGDAFLNRGNYFMAYTQYGKSLEKNPDNPTVIYKQGLALLLDKNPGEAVPLFQQALDIQPGFAPALEGLGRAYFSSGNQKAAEIYFQKAITQDPLLWRSYHYLGMIHDKNNRHDAAISDYTAALTINPGAGFIHNNLGVALSAAGRTREAVAAFQQALSTGHTPEIVFNNLGWALCKLERYDEAFQAFERAGGIAVAYNNTGVGYLKNGHREKAAEYFRKAIEESPKFYVTAHENLQKALKKN